MIYEVIGGSRSYDLSIDSSDYDLLRVSDTNLGLGYHENGCNVLQVTYDEFKQRGTLEHDNWYAFQWLFPHEFRSDNNLTAWIKANREDMIKANLPRVYSILMSFAEQFSIDPEILYPKFSKRLVKAIHFRNLLYNYANGMTFAEAHVAQGDMRDFLLSVHRGKLELPVILEQNAIALEKAKSVETFYTSRIVTTSIFDEFKSMVDAEIDKLSATD